MVEEGFNNVVEVGGRAVGRGQPTCLVAEIGINHNGDMSLARQQIAAAAGSGADMVKFQNYMTEDFVASRDLPFTYYSQGREVTEPQYDLFKRCELSVDQLAELKAECDRQGVLFQSTPTSRQGVRDLVDIGAAALKNGSDCLQHLDLIRAMGESGLPTVVSLGMATLAEVEAAVAAFRATGNKNLILLHCVSAYPAPKTEANLARLQTLARAFGCPVGFSDHTEGHMAAAVTAALGGCLVEKHFTTSHDLPGPDHWFSATPDEFAALVNGVRDAEAVVGQPDVRPTDSEADARSSFRLSCVAARALVGGQRLRAADIAFSRPGTGIPPEHAYLLAGRALARDVASGHVLTTEDFA
jgi:sialic acid synthase SpsE